MIKTVQFGDVFLHNSTEYIFLAQKDEIIYAAKILIKHDGDRIKEYCETQLKNPKNQYKAQNNILFCYVELTTDKYKNRIAHLKSAAKDESQFPFELLDCRLNINDLLELKKEILTGAVDIALKKLVQNIDIPKNQSR